MDIKFALQEFGLTEKEIRVYVKLLELGSATSGELMKVLSLYSKTAYEILDRLIEKGLVSYVVSSNIKHFEAATPEKFLDILSEEESKLKRREASIKDIIPALLSQRKLGRDPQEATIYKGKNGLKSVFDDVLKGRGEVLVFGAGGKFKATLGSYSDLWHKKRAKLGIPLRVLWNENLRSRTDYLKQFGLISVRFLPKEFDNPAPALIYRDKVAIMIWSETPIITLLRSKEVANTFRSYFDTIWRKIAKI
ncbi:MAG: helix-turn-helix domain-containing protein [Candidatus Woesearchaeota archaeon]